MRKIPPLTMTPEARTKAVASLQRYALDELDVSMGDLKAGLLLDYILAEHGPAIYNAAISDARSFIEERAADLDAALQRAEFPYFATRKR
ncbi:MAG: DUF2164 domain-containing protein [Gemmatimonadota bacterium]|nr:DUF2164 domain-containing protein [Gemmatimonadota bacterium]